MALLDAVVNNADRKGGHVLLTARGEVYGVDHGVCFSVEDKLRTVLWGWAGSPLSPDEVAVLSELRALLDGALGHRLGSLLDHDEVRATVARVDRLLEECVLPFPVDGWPAIPWPPF
jgi:uncharacterized repeat protein (TIGR03843 family)